MEWSCIHRKLGAGIQPLAQDQQFPWIYKPCLPGALWESLYLWFKRRCSLHKGKWNGDYRTCLCKRPCRSKAAKGKNRQENCSCRFRSFGTCRCRPVKFKRAFRNGLWTCRQSRRITALRYSEHEAGKTYHWQKNQCDESGRYWICNRCQYRCQY